MFTSTVIEVGYGTKYWVVCPDRATPNPTEWAVTSDWRVSETLLNAASECGAAPRKAEFGSGLSYSIMDWEIRTGI